MLVGSTRCCADLELAAAGKGGDGGPFEAVVRAGREDGGGQRVAVGRYSVVVRSAVGVGGDRAVEGADSSDTGFVHMARLGAGGVVHKDSMCNHDDGTRLVFESGDREGISGWH